MQDREIRSRIVGVNVPRKERIASGVLGGAALAFGLRRGSLGGLVLAGLGGAAVLRAITGRCGIYRARAIRKGLHVRRAVTIQGTPAQIYDVWRDLANVPRFFRHVADVTVLDDKRSRWVIHEGPAQLAWTAEIVEELPGRRLRWRSLPGGDVANEGTIDLREATGGRGTVVEVKLHYFPPGGLVVAAALGDFFRKLTEAQIGEDLARLQQLIETGEIATGARRIDEPRADDRAISASEIVGSPAPHATAERSSWVPGGAR